MEPNKIIVATDDDGNEAIYKNGKLHFTEGGTVYACDIAEATEDKPTLFTHVSLGFTVGDWPQKYADLHVPD